ncbi:GNAT family N-acetyltransferase [Ketogulonicigenium robustum]|uniref:GNAT family N-acetyltransferase n=1 Tax=Ketogulonicigenium robustum TaxID=92947 RepID=UPI001F2EC643|nr:GNAT family N-acetyltransferase [Ketogulonicigenium robustum]
MAALYWQAFGRKLGPILAPRKQAQRFLQLALRQDHAICAIDQLGAVVGVVGFCSENGGLVYDHGFAILQTYGQRSAAWRVRLMNALFRDSPLDTDFQMDGLFVAPEARGNGIGTRLLAAFAAEGRSRGFTRARLEVANTNARARALYERNGYQATSTDHLGWQRVLFGYRSTTTMVVSL